MNVQRYQELRPAQFDEAIRNMPVCYVPVGSIEWHGEHMPLGVDTFRAVMTLEAVAERFGGIVYPPIYTGIPGEVAWDRELYDYDANVMITDKVFRALMEDIVGRLKGAGFRGIIMLTCHHPHTQPTILKELAAEHSDESCRIWGECDPVLGGLYKGDHAGYGETSFMLHRHADKVNVELLRERSGHGVSKDQDGSPQAFRASAETGRAMVESAVEKIGEILRGWGLVD